MKIREGKRYIAWLYICFMAALFSSCQFVNDYRTIRSMKRSTIVFPEEMLVMRNHDLSFGHPNCDSLLFIVYFDSGDDCLPCVTTHLPDLNELNSYLAALGVKFSLINATYKENAGVLYTERRWKDCLQELNRALGVDSDDYLLSKIAECYYQMKNYKQALDWFERSKKARGPDAPADEFVESRLVKIREELFFQDALPPAQAGQR